MNVPSFSAQVEGMEWEPLFAVMSDMGLAIFLFNSLLLWRYWKEENILPVMLHYSTSQARLAIIIIMFIYALRRTECLYYFHEELQAFSMLY